MTGKPYTDDDVQLVAATFVAEAKKNPIKPGTPPWLGVQTRMLLGPNEHDIARAVLDALSAAGRLADARHIVEIWPGGWTIRHPLSCPQDLVGCPVGQVVGPAMASAAPGRYECSANDLGDRFLLGERVDQAEG